MGAFDFRNRNRKVRPLLHTLKQLLVEGRLGKMGCEPKEATFPSTQYLARASRRLSLYIDNIPHLKYVERTQENYLLPFKLSPYEYHFLDQDLLPVWCDFVP
jgi:hypothetical protein